MRRKKSFTERDILRNCGHASFHDGARDRIGGVALEPGRDQPGVVLVGGQQVAGREVAGLDAVAVGHPGRGHDGLVAGQHHDLVDGRLLLAGGVRDGDGPDPAAVAALPAAEAVGDDALVLGGGTEVLPHDVLAHLLDESGAREVGRLEGHRVGCVDHGAIVPGRTGSCLPGPAGVGRMWSWEAALDA